MQKPTHPTDLTVLEMQRWLEVLDLHVTEARVLTEEQMRRGQHSHSCRVVLGTNHLPATGFEGEGCNLQKAFVAAIQAHTAWRAEKHKKASTEKAVQETSKH